MRMPQTQRNTRPNSRVNFEREDSTTVHEDLTVFEDKIGNKDRIGPKSKYPNIELKREYGAKNFRDSNRQITRLASTRAGTMRSCVQTTQPSKRGAAASNNQRSSTRKQKYEKLDNQQQYQMEEQNGEEENHGESESQY